MPQLGAATSDGIVLNVTSGPGAGQVTLAWTGSLPPYSIYRSASPAGVVAPANLVAVTGTQSWSETPPVGNIIYYEVKGIGCASGAECPSGFCVDGVCCGTACDGTCQACNVAGSQGTCTPIAAGQDPSGECGPNGVCDGLGSCRERNGVACALGSDCLSAHCVDGVCCDTACSGLCEQCNLAGAAGTCSASPGGTNPDNDCATQPASTCGQNGVCSGSRTCSLYPNGTVCAGSSCASGTSLNLPDKCDGAGTCADAGVQSCVPYTCDSAASHCRASCTTDAQCAPGFRCEVSTGLCLAAFGQPCVSDAGCFGHACCSNVCRDLTSDPNDCGGCSLVCTNPHGTIACTGSNCAPGCASGWGSCDGNTMNGCETSLTTNTNCAACGVPCSRSNASSSCSTGACVLGSCTSGFDNCDGNDGNGCETSHASAPNACATGTNMGAFSGDSVCGPFCLGNTNWTQFNSATGRTSAWFHARVSEVSSCLGTIEHQIRLLVPANVDYDLYVYRPCGTLVGSSTNGTGAAETVTVQQGDNLTGDDSFDYWVEVRYFGGSSCSAWTIQFFGHSC